jgi:hypothetical protein
MATIFPTSPAPQVNDVFQGYRYNGTSWEIIGVDLTADYQPRVANVSDTEVGYLDGVTSAIQTQLTDKSTASKTETLTNKTLTTPKINENVNLTTTSTELNVLDGITASTAELNIMDGVTSTATELNILDGATLTTTELNYVDGVTSSIQTQLGTKAPLASPTFTGTVTIPEGASISGYLTTSSASTTYATKAEVTEVQNFKTVQNTTMFSMWTMPLNLDDSWSNGNGTSTNSSSNGPNIYSYPMFTINKQSASSVVIIDFDMIIDIDYDSFQGEPDL